MAEHSPTITIESLNSWNKQISVISELDKADVKVYAEEFGLPESLVSSLMDKEIRFRAYKDSSRNLFFDMERVKVKMDALKHRSSEYVKKATKAYKNSKEALAKETERADQSEKSVSELKRQLDMANNVIRKRDGGISEIEIFLTTLDTNSFRGLERAVMKSLHPDKHPGVNAETNRGLNRFFSIIHTIFNQVTGDL